MLPSQTGPRVPTLPKPKPRISSTAGGGGKKLRSYLSYMGRKTQMG